MKLTVSNYLRDAALVGIFVFLWNANSRLSSIETTLKLITDGKIVATTKP